MATTALERFCSRATALGVEVTVRSFPQGTRTAADAAAAVGCDVGQIVKSLVFDADGDAILVLTSGANRVDVDRLAAHLNAARVGKADADQVRSATGFAIGGTPPFGHDTPIVVVCDRDLLAHEQVWAAAGTPTDVFPMQPTELVRITGADVIDVAAR